MARWRQAIELAMTAEEVGILTVVSRARTEPARRVERAQMLLAYETGDYLAPISNVSSELIVCLRPRPGRRRVRFARTADRESC
jgi:hypothetical protein